MRPRRDVGSSKAEHTATIAKHTATNGAMKRAKRAKRAKINPLSGAALAVILTVPVLILGFQPEPGATAQKRGGPTHYAPRQANVDSVQAAHSGSQADQRSQAGHGSQAGQGSQGTGAGNAGQGTGAGNAGQGTGAGNAGQDTGAGNAGQGTGAGNAGQGTGAGNAGQGTGAGNAGQGTGAGNAGQGTGAGNAGQGTGAGNAGQGTKSGKPGSGTGKTPQGSTGTPTSVAPGGPGATSYFDLARKNCVGTAAPNGSRASSKVWYTVAGGVLSDVYEPTVDNTNVGTLQYVVTDGTTFTDLQTRDLSYTVSADPSGMACTVTATSTRHGYRLVTTYMTDPSIDTVLMRTSLERSPGSHTDLGALHVYARLDAHVNGNGGGGTANGGPDTGVVESTPGAAVPVIYDTSATSQAANRDYAVPTYMALLSTSRARTASVGYAGTASDGLTQLDASHALTTRYTSAPDGHIIATEDVTPAGGTGGAGGKTVTLALGFGRSLSGALAAAGGSLRQPFGSVLDAYQLGWRTYDAGLNRPPATVPGLGKDQVSAAYYLSANVLKASEDKTFAGAIVASLASPWGQAVSAGAAPGGKAVYFGSYREVFSRDLYEVFTGLLLDGDLATARAATLFLLERQQLPTGEIPRNSLLNGRAAPDTGGDQLDETSYPILMAYQAGLGGDTALWRQHIIPAADFLVSRGPSYGVERWEEQSGYSPSTIAAEIAGLTAAAAIATQQGDSARAQVYQATADDFQRQIKTWTVTTTGPDGPGYFIRLSKTGDPNAAISYSLGNGGPTLDQRQVLDGGFQELVRLGELPVSDPDVQASLGIWDKMISVSTPSGTGYYRYGNNASLGSADGYGDCYQPSQTSCTTKGEPWPTTDTGTGHLWPVLSGERAESDIASNDLNGGAGLLGAMMHFSSGWAWCPSRTGRILRCRPRHSAATPRRLRSALPMAVRLVPPRRCRGHRHRNCG